MSGTYLTRQLLLIVMLCAAVVSAAAVAVGAPSSPPGLLADPLRCAVVASNPDLPRDLFDSRITLWNTGGQEIDASRRERLALVESPLSDACTNRWQIGFGLRRALTLTVAAQPAAPGVLSLSIAATPPDGVSAVGICVPKANDEHFYGLGERFGDLDLAGQRLENWTVDAALPQQAPMTYAPTPFLLSSRGYGLLLDTTTQATFDLRLSVEGCYRVRIESPVMHLYLIAGPHPQTVVERHAHLVGLPPLPPAWAIGVWKTLIGGQARATSDLARLRGDDVPVDAVWIYDAVDERAGFGWPWQIYGPIAPGSYPDLVGFIRQLHTQDLKVLGYLNPFLYPGTASFEEARRRDFLVRAPDGQPYVETWSFGERAYMDFTNYTLDDEYLIGDDLLVAPVLEAGQSERRLYLPSGRWRDYWTGAVQQGPGWIMVAAPVQRVPLFVRAGATVALPDPADLKLPEVVSANNSARLMTKR